MEKKFSRREMLRRSALGALGFTIVPRFVLGGAGYTPPSETLTKAVIGVGNMGRYHLRYEGAKLLAVCDVDAVHLARALDSVREEGNRDVKGYRDFREVLDRPDIDIVHIATPPHWHGVMSVAAAEAGKDIWCEKPMTRTIGEGQKVIEAVEKHGRIFRVNTWFRFQSHLYGFGSSARAVRKAVASGLLGWPLKMTVNQATGFDWKHRWSGRTDLTPTSVPSQLDYDLWLGPAPEKPYHPHRTHITFRGYWDYDGGGLGDMGQHFLDPLQYVLGKDDTSPVFIQADAPLQHPDAVGYWRRVEMKYADGCQIILDGANDDKDAALVEGPLGKLYPGFKCTVADFEKKLAAFADPEPQTGDFAEAVRSRQKFALNEKNAHRSCTLVNLAKIAIRCGRRLEFDPVAQRFVNDEEANRLVEEPMRAPWRV